MSASFVEVVVNKLNAQIRGEDLEFGTIPTAFGDPLICAVRGGKSTLVYEIVHFVSHTGQSDVFVRRDVPNFDAPADWKVVNSPAGYSLVQAIFLDVARYQDDTKVGA